MHRTTAKTNWQVTVGLSVSAVFIVTVGPTWAGEHEHTGHEHQNHVAVFVGDTHSENRDSFTLGVDYERRPMQANYWLGFVGTDDLFDIENFFLTDFLGYRGSYPICNGQGGVEREDSLAKMQGINVDWRFFEQ